MTERISRQIVLATKSKWSCAAERFPGLKKQRYRFLEQVKSCSLCNISRLIPTCVS